METIKQITVSCALKDMVPTGVTVIVRGMVQSVLREVCTRALVDYYTIQLF